jgi:hypothetical protein
LSDLFKIAILDDAVSDNSKRIFALQEEYIKTIDPVSVFCKGKSNLALQICQEDYLPEASRFAQLEELDWLWNHGNRTRKAFGDLVPRRYLILLWNV